MKHFFEAAASALATILIAVVLAAWAAALILSGPALLKLCITYLFL